MLTKELRKWAEKHNIERETIEGVKRKRGEIICFILPSVCLCYNRWRRSL